MMKDKSTLLAAAPSCSEGDAKACKAEIQPAGTDSPAACCRRDLNGSTQLRPGTDVNVSENGMRKMHISNQSAG